ncbi:hypothetical protein [Actinomadura logoneensis]|uniref:hypothetical protein n=1 Tax=Actinomadura logoneensis TaxID=2293572 RepID=UPI0011C198E4|nr:hypothetical protein [Actinomadura logoneensis]
MKPEIIAALAAAGGTLLTAVGLPATYLQARAARKAASSSVEAAQISARALHLQTRRTVQRDAYLGVLTATDEFRRAAWSRTLAPILHDSRDLDEITDEMADAHNDLLRAIAVVTLDSPDDVAASVQLIKDHAETLFYSCQSDENEDMDEPIWWVAGKDGDELASSSRVIDLFDNARKKYISTVRKYLNDEVPEIT